MNGYSGASRGLRLTATVGFLVAISALSGCAIMGGGETEVAPKSQTILMQEAESARDSGNDEAAVRLFREASESNPVTVNPWLRIAQIRFDSDNYGDAIVAAEEAVSREPSNRDGNSIIIVSSLRLAERAISALRDDNKLDGSVRSEARELAQQLRETLGEDALVGDRPASRRSSRRSSSARRASRSRSAPARSAPSKPSSSSASSSTGQSSSATSDTAPADSGDKGSGDDSLNPFESLQTLPE